MSEISIDKQANIALGTELLTVFLDFEECLQKLEALNDLTTDNSNSSNDKSNKIDSHLTKLLKVIINNILNDHSDEVSEHIRLEAFRVLNNMLQLSLTGTINIGKNIMKLLVSFANFIVRLNNLSPGDCNYDTIQKESQLELMDFMHKEVYEFIWLIVLLNSQFRANIIQVLRTNLFENCSPNVDNVIWALCVFSYILNYGLHDLFYPNTGTHDVDLKSFYSTIDNESLFSLSRCLANTLKLCDDAYKRQLFIVAVFNWLMAMINNNDSANLAVLFNEIQNIIVFVFTTNNAITFNYCIKYDRLKTYFTLLELISYKTPAFLLCRPDDNTHQQFSNNDFSKLNVLNVTQNRPTLACMILGLLINLLDGFTVASKSGKESLNSFCSSLSDDLQPTTLSTLISNVLQCIIIINDILVRSDDIDLDKLNMYHDSVFRFLYMFYTAYTTFPESVFLRFKSNKYSAIRSLSPSQLVYNKFITKLVVFNDFSLLYRTILAACSFYGVNLLSQIFKLETKFIPYNDYTHVMITVISNVIKFSNCSSLSISIKKIKKLERCIELITLRTGLYGVAETSDNVFPIKNIVEQVVSKCINNQDNEKSLDIDAAEHVFSNVISKAVNTELTDINEKKPDEHEKSTLNNDDELADEKKDSHKRFFTDVIPDSLTLSDLSTRKLIQVNVESVASSEQVFDADSRSDTDKLSFTLTSSSFNEISSRELSSNDLIDVPNEQLPNNTESKNKIDACNDHTMFSNTKTSSDSSNIGDVTVDKEIISEETYENISEEKLKNDIIEAPNDGNQKENYVNDCKSNNNPTFSFSFDISEDNLL